MSKIIDTECTLVYESAQLQFPQMYMPVVEMRIAWVQETKSMYELMGQLIVKPNFSVVYSHFFFNPDWLNTELHKIYVQIQITVQFSDHFRSCNYFHECFITKSVLIPCKSDLNAYLWVMIQNFFLIPKRLQTIICQVISFGM